MRSLPHPPRREIDNDVYRDPACDHEVPIDRVHGKIELMLFIDLTNKGIDGQKYVFRSGRDQVEHMQTKHCPDNGAVCMTVPSTVQCREFEAANNDADKTNH